MEETNKDSFTNFLTGNSKKRLWLWGGIKGIFVAEFLLFVYTLIQKLTYSGSGADFFDTGDPFIIMFVWGLNPMFLLGSFIIGAALIYSRERLINKKKNDK